MCVNFSGSNCIDKGRMDLWDLPDGVKRTWLRLDINEDTNMNRDAKRKKLLFTKIGTKERKFALKFEVPVW